MCKLFYRYMRIHKLSGQAFLLLDRNCRNFFKYVEWLYAREKKVIVHFAPNAVLNLIKTLRLGVLHSYGDAIIPLWHDR